MEGGQFVIDASVIVKWLHAYREDHLEQAHAILEAAQRTEITLFISDLTVHEVLNAIICGKRLRGNDLEQAVDDFFKLPLIPIETDIQCAAAATTIAAQYTITFYDAVYCAIAFQKGIPLITANPKHQRPMPGVTAIPLAKWTI